MTLLQQGLDVLVQIALAHLLCGVVVANDRPATRPPSYGH